MQFPMCRQVIADAVLADPYEWNEAVLGKAPAEYCAWIRDPSRWGGAIELSILSRHLGREIAAFDIQTTRVGAWVLRQLCWVGLGACTNGCADQFPGSCAPSLPTLASNTDSAPHPQLSYYDTRRPP
jgi:hypothetical protein